METSKQHKTNPKGEHKMNTELYKPEIMKRIKTKKARVVKTVRKLPEVLNEDLLYVDLKDLKTAKEMSQTSIFLVLARQAVLEKKYCKQCPIKAKTPSEKFHHCIKVCPIGAQFQLIGDVYSKKVQERSSKRREERKQELQSKADKVKEVVEEQKEKVKSEKPIKIHKPRKEEAPKDTQPKKLGRPRKHPETPKDTTPKKRGRPRKNPEEN